MDAADGCTGGNGSASVAGRGFRKARKSWFELMMGK